MPVVALLCSRLFVMLVNSETPSGKSVKANVQFTYFVNSLFPLIISFSAVPPLGHETHGTSSSSGCKNKIIQPIVRRNLTYDPGSSHRWLLKSAEDHDRRWWIYELSRLRLPCPCPQHPPPKALAVKEIENKDVINDIAPPWRMSCWIWSGVGMDHSKNKTKH